MGSIHLHAESNFLTAKKKVLEAVQTHFLPEFINRLDELVVFNPLSEDLTLRIVTQHLDALQNLKALKERGIELKVDDKAVRFILMKAHNTQYGARPVRRFIDQQIGTYLARMILEGSIPEAGAIIDISASTSLTFSICRTGDSSVSSLRKRRLRFQRPDPKKICRKSSN